MLGSSRERGGARAAGCRQGSVAGFWSLWRGAPGVRHTDASDRRCHGAERSADVQGAGHVLIVRSGRFPQFRQCGQSRAAASGSPCLGNNRPLACCCGVACAGSLSPSSICSPRFHWAHTTFPPSNAHLRHRDHCIDGPQTTWLAHAATSTGIFSSTTTPYYPLHRATDLRSRLSGCILCSRIPLRS